MGPHDRGCTWWDDRWAWRGALVAGPLGALAAILHALLVLRASPGEALVLYVVGGLLASGTGCLLAGPLGGTACAVRRWRAARRAEPALEPYPDLEPYREPDPVRGQPARDDAGAGRHARATG